MCRIVVDLQEARSSVPSALSGVGIDVSLRRLPVGDYDVGAGVVVERKTVPDLERSLCDGRFWKQIGDLCAQVRVPYLVVEGHLGGNAQRGACLAVMRAKPLEAEVPEAMLAAVPSISVATARALLDRFETVRATVAAGPAAWRTVPGVGERRAAELDAAVSRKRPRP